MNRHSAVADKAAQRNPGGGGSDVRVLYMCGCKSLRAGTKWRGNLPLLCARCNAKAAA